MLHHAFVQTKAFQYWDIFTITLPLFVVVTDCSSGSAECLPPEPPALPGTLPAMLLVATNDKKNATQKQRSFLPFSAQLWNAPSTVSKNQLSLAPTHVVNNGFLLLMQTYNQGQSVWSLRCIYQWFSLLLIFNVDTHCTGTNSITECNSETVLGRGNCIKDLG